MKVNYQYMSPSMCIQKENHTTLGLAADNSRKERVSFQGKLKDPLIFRDAMLMLREIVISGKEIEKKERKEDKVKTAVALAYEAGDAAPKILATGKGELAERIIEKGREGNVPLYKDNKLAKTLSKLEIGDMIPPELYEVVAEILVFVDDMDRLRSKIK